MRKRLLWRRGSSMRAWLFTMLHNLYVNQVRSQARQPTLQPEQQQEAAGNHDPSRSDVLMSDIERCMAQLSEDQRQVLLLVALEGFSYKEVSKVLKLPVGTVMSRLSRAREAMRRLMEGDTGPALRRVK